VSRVIYNRLPRAFRWADDSTINYVLDQPLLATVRSARRRVGRGRTNTYSQQTFLTPTPISSPSQDAISGPRSRADGPWILLRQCDKNGNSCFADDPGRAATPTSPKGPCGGAF